MLFFVRNKFLIFSQLFLPALLLYIANSTNQLRTDQFEYSPPLKLSLDPFPKSYVTLFHETNNQDVNGIASVYNTSFTSPKIEFNVIPLKENDLNATTNYLVDLGKKDLAKYNLYHLIGARFSLQAKDSKQLSLTALFNNQAFHASAISLAYLDEVLLKHVLDQDQLKYGVWNHPMPKRDIDASQSREFDTTKAVQLVDNIQISVAFLMASFVILLVKEKVTNFRHIQQISGLNLGQYWLSNFMLDFINYAISSALMLVVIYFSNISPFDSMQGLLNLSAVFVFHGLAAMPFMYVMSLLFADAATAYVRVSLYIVISGMTTFLVVLILQIPTYNLLNVSHILDYLFSFILPVYTLATCVMSLYQNYIGQKSCLAEFDIGGGKKRKVQDLCTLGQEFPLFGCCRGE